MGYVFGATKKRPMVAATPEPVETPKKARPKQTRKGTVPGRKRGQGKNNKHGNGCGTNNGWAAHKRAGEDPCAPCIRANLDYKTACKHAAEARKVAA